MNGYDEMLEYYNEGRDFLSEADGDFEDCGEDVPCFDCHPECMGYYCGYEEEGE